MEGENPDFFTLQKIFYYYKGTGKNLYPFTEGEWNKRFYSAFTFKLKYIIWNNNIKIKEYKYSYMFAIYSSYINNHLMIHF